MKYVIANNRLKADFKKESLEKLSTSALQSIANQLHLGVRNKSVKVINIVDKRGLEIEKEIESFETKSNLQLRKEIEKALTISFDIPNTYWTEEQWSFWASNEMAELQNAEVEARLKEEAGIRINMMPYDERASARKKLLMTAEVTQEVYDWIVEIWNQYTDGMKKDTGGNPIKRIKKREYIVVLEKIEEDNDIEEEEDEKPKAKVSSKSK